MGYYINPPNMSKEQFLLEHGKPISVSKAEAHNWKGNTLPVCLVDNGAFTAAGIAYSAQEAQAFLRPDGRAKAWFEVSKAELEPYYKEKV